MSKINSAIEFLTNYPIDIPNLSPNLKCILCKSLLKNAKQTKCGCKACEKCIRKYLEIGPKNCPNKECVDEVLKTDKDFYTDNATNKEIQNLKVKCPFENCSQFETVIEISRHVQQCEYRVETCDVCRQQYLARDKQNHVCPAYNREQDCSTESKGHGQELSYIAREIALLRETVEGLQTKLDNQNILIQEMFTVNKTLTETNMKLTKKISTLESDRSNPVAIVKNTNDFRNGNFIWQIKNVRSQSLGANNSGLASITSTAFYTSEFGYKLCLRVYPSGDGMGKGTHLSVFFALMKGEYDDLLPWPFRQKITLSLLDQETFTKHLSETFKPDPKSPCFQKPVKECNIASGSPKFLALSQLTSNFCYYKNDTIYIKISIDQTGIHKP